MSDESPNGRPAPEAPNPPAAPGTPQPAEGPLAEGAPAADSEELAELRRKAAEHDALMDRLKRVTADFINAERRLERRAEDRMAYAIESFARDLLPVVDDVSRAIQSARDHATDKNVLDGLELVEKQLQIVLERHGITPLETKIGEPFDSNGHEAISVSETDAMPPNRVVAEAQRGYRFLGRILRPARVVVSGAKK